MADLKDIVRQYLHDNGYDGLFHAGVCACEADDLFPCSEPSLWCEAGYRVEGCSVDCGEGCAFHIVREKPPTGKGGE